MPRLYRAFGAAFGLLMSVLATGQLYAADEPKPFIVYDAGLQNGWINWSWATVQIAFPAGNAKPIRAEAEPWAAVALHHDPFSTKDFKKLTFVINGGVDGGQELAIKLVVDGKAVDSNYIIHPKAKTWARAEIPLKDIGGVGQAIDGVWIQAQGTACKPFYVTRIQFE